MRFIGMFFLVLTVMVLLGAFAWWSFDHGRVWLAGRELASDFMRTKRWANFDTEVYVKECSLPVAALPNSMDKPLMRPTVAGIRLRFVNDNNYVIEAVCDRPEKGPIPIITAILPFGVMKTAGSGVMVPVVDERLIESPKAHPLESRVVLRAGTVYRVIGFVEDQLVNKLTLASYSNVGADSAEAACAGWGSSCCNEATQVGEGDRQDKVLDCPKQCFPVCLERPSVVFFNTDPPIDGATRVVALTGREVSVRFGFELIDLDGQVAEAIIDFGDGKREPLKEIKGVVGHIYRCMDPSCEYEARLELTDDDGLPMVESRIAQVTVRIKS
jgi:hypothetical protein